MVLWIRIRSRIRIRSDPKLFAGSGSGVGINHFGSGSGQPSSGMNLKQNFSDKIHNISTRLCIRFPIRYHTGRINYLLCYNIQYCDYCHGHKNSNHHLFLKNRIYIFLKTVEKPTPDLEDMSSNPLCGKNSVHCLTVEKTLGVMSFYKIYVEYFHEYSARFLPRNSLEVETSVAGSETGSGSGVGAETSLNVGSETNHSGSTALLSGPSS